MASQLASIQAWTEGNFGWQTNRLEKEVLKVISWGRPIPEALLLSEVQAPTEVVLRAASDLAKKGWIRINKNGAEATYELL